MADTLPGETIFCRDVTVRANKIFPKSWLPAVQGPAVVKIVGRDTDATIRQYKPSPQTAIPIFTNIFLVHVVLVNQICQLFRQSVIISQRFVCLYFVDNVYLQKLSFRDIIQNLMNKNLP